MRFPISVRLTLLLVLATNSPLVAQDNVLVILADDIGVDSVGCYGEGPDPPPPPTIDALCTEGVLFRNCWSNPVCSPTRAHIQTGRYGFRTGLGFVISEKGWALPLEETLLPELLDLGDSGYAHTAFGKWHLTNRTVGGPLHPELSGYSHFVGSQGNIGSPFDYFWWDRVDHGLLSFENEYATTAIVDAFLEWQATAPEPWFAYIAFHAAHDPLHEPPAHLHTQVLPPVDPREEPRPFYKAVVEAMDTEMGRLLTGLGDQRDRTNVVFLGDNGTPQHCSLAPFVPEHAKLTPYEGGVNVPLIVNGPIVVQPGREVAELINTVDIFGTVLDLAGVDPLAVAPDLVLDSVSPVRYLTHPGHKPLRSWVYAEMWKPNGEVPKHVDYRAARDERYKLIRSGLGPDVYDWELYDLQADPFEEVDLLHQGVALTPDQLNHYKSLQEVLRGLIGG